MIQWVMQIWREAQRRVDLQMLWPSCKRHAPDLEHAKAVFYWHTMQDEAWTTDYTDTELIDFVDALR
jgi:hypothetical protein